MEKVKVKARKKTFNEFSALCQVMIRTRMPATCYVAQVAGRLGGLAFIFSFSVAPHRLALLGPFLQSRDTISTSVDFLHEVLMMASRPTAH